MFEQIISLLMNCVTSSFDWFSLILTTIDGSFKYIITFYTAYLITRFLLTPIVGSFSGPSESKRGYRNNSKSSGKSNGKSKGGD